MTVKSFIVQALALVLIIKVNSFTPFLKKLGRFGDNNEMNQLTKRVSKLN
jgi:hypothetical protein